MMLSASLPHRLLTSLKDLGVHLMPTDLAGQSGGGLPAVKIVVAFSAGMDSAVMLDALAQLKTQFRLELYAAYYNHQWRPGAPKELPVLHKLSEALQIPLILIEADRTLAKTETVARQHRYRALCSLAHDLDAQAVVTAHHADDQIETILFRILRGTGIDGLVGIQRELSYPLASGATIPVLRPMLGIAKDDIIEYARQRQLRYFEDPSNQNTKIQRNLIRKKILPDLQAHFPHVKNSLYKIALLAEGDQQILEAGMGEVWQRVYLSDEKGFYLDSPLFNQLELPYQRRVLKRYFTANHMDFDFQIIEDTLTFIRGEHRQDVSIGLKSISSFSSGNLSSINRTARTSSGEETQEPDLYFLSLYKNRLRILKLNESSMEEPKTRQSGEAEAIKIPLPGSAWSESLKVNIDISPVPEASQSKLSKHAVLKASALLDPNLAYMDLTLFIDTPEMLEAPKPLELRTRRQGDKFFPMGMDAPMRLKKYLMNQGIPRFERENLPMLASGEHILWIPGHGISEFVKVNGKPTHRVQIEYCDVAPPPVLVAAAVSVSEAEAALAASENQPRQSIEPDFWQQRQKEQQEDDASEETGADLQPENLRQENPNQSAFEQQDLSQDADDDYESLD